MQAFLKLLNLLFLLMFILATIMAAFNGIDLYLILTGQVQPGEPMYVGEVAPTLPEAVGGLVTGLIAAIIFIFARLYIRKKLIKKLPETSEV